MNDQCKEILWNVVNSLLAGFLVFIGAFSDGQLSQQEALISLGAALAIAVTQFKDYWKSEESEYCNKTLGSFINL